MRSRRYSGLLNPMLIVTLHQCILLDGILNRFIFLLFLLQRIGDVAIRPSATCPVLLLRSNGFIHL